MSTDRKCSENSRERVERGERREEEEIYICVVLNYSDDGGLVEVEVVGIVGVATIQTVI